MLFQKLGAEHTSKLAEFFERNATPETSNQFNPFPLTQQTAAELLDPARKDLYFGILDENKIIAFSMLRGPDEGYSVPSFGIIVDQLQFGKGIGKYLARWTLLWADQKGFGKVRLSVFSDNPLAISLYEKLGFKKVDTRSLNGRKKLIMLRIQRADKIALYVSLLALKPSESLADRLQSWNQAGLNHIEATWYPLSDDESPEAVFNLPKAIIHNYFPPEPDNPILNLSSPDKRVRSRTRDFFEKRIKMSDRLNAAWYSLHAGFITDPIGRDTHGFTFPSPSPEARPKAIARFAEEIALLIPIAQSRNLSILIENNVCSPSNLGKLLLVTPQDFQDIFTDERTKSNLGILLDTGHMNVSANSCRFQKEDFLTLSHRIIGMHLHQNDGTADQHLPVLANDWPVDFALEIQPQFASLEGRYSSLSDLQQAYLQIHQRFNG